MTAVVGVETVLLVVLLVLVVGLLRSHAEILRRLGSPGAAVHEPPAAPLRPTARRREATAAPLAGATPAGDAVALDVATRGPTLLAFLTTGCSTCAGFWDALGKSQAEPEIQTVIVTHDRDRESPSRLRKLAPANTPVIMSSRAWTDYEVPGSPYFVLVDGAVRGEGVATTWDALASLVTDALEDQRSGGGSARARHIDEVLAAAGIGPEHPSLYPGGREA